MNTSKIVMHLFEIAARCGMIARIADELDIEGFADCPLPIRLKDLAEMVLQNAQAIMQEIIDDQLRVCQERKELEEVIARPEPLGTATNGGRGHGTDR